MAAIVAGLRAVSVAADCSTIIIIILFSDFRLAGYLEEEGGVFRFYNSRCWGDKMVRLIGFGILAVLLNVQAAGAGWDATVEEAAFGKTTARAASDYKGGSSFFFECVNDELAFGIIVIARNDQGQHQAGNATIRVMVDEPPHEDFTVEIGSTIGGMLRLTSTDPDDAEKLAFKVMAAKNKIDTGVLQGDGGIWLATKRSTRGVTAAISKVLKACNVEMPEPPAAGSVLQVKDAAKMPWLTLCLYDKKPGVSCNCELIDQSTCRFTGAAKKRKN